MLCASYFYARWLLYHNVALTYKALNCKIQKNRFTVTIALIVTVPRWTFMGHRNQMCSPVPWRSQCLWICHEWQIWSHTLKKVPQPQHSRISIGDEEGKNTFWEKKRLIYRTYSSKDRTVIVLMTNSGPYETFDDRSSFFILIFLWINRLFCQNVFFTLSATNNRVYRSTWVNPLAGNCTMC